MSLWPEYQAPKRYSLGLEAPSLTAQAFGFGHFSSPQFHDIDHCFLPALQPKFHHPPCFTGALVTTCLSLTKRHFSLYFVLEPKSEMVRPMFQNLIPLFSNKANSVWLMLFCYFYPFFPVWASLKLKLKWDIDAINVSKRLNGYLNFQRRINQLAAKREEMFPLF